MEFKNQKEMFFHIWESRPHKSEVSGTYLGEEAKAHYFAHILSKGAYPSYKLDPDNIVLLTMQEHHDFDAGIKDLKNDPKWKWVLEKTDKLIAKYYRK